ncbi:hypothetical protein [Clavibacter sp. km3a]|uniref:hypothetical protein n=1 Tax=Clavibacter sp. km3a TaxID=3459135 RepID=UPI004041D170
MSARRGTWAFASARESSTGSVHDAVPTMRSWRPSDSRISVESWSSDTTREGAWSTVTSCPQFDSVSG